MIRHTSASEAVYGKLKEEIIHLQLPPGGLVSELDTSAKYGVSRTPVRDAFKMLEREGLLTITPHVGTFVSKINLDEISDILYMRKVLEHAILRELAASYDPAQDYRVRIILQRQKELLDSNADKVEIGREFIKLDNEFHMTLYDLAGKANVAKLFYSLNSQYERFRTFINFKSIDELKVLYGEHEAIWDAITKGDVDEVEERITHHIYNGFNANIGVVCEHPEYFLTSNS